MSKRIHSSPDEYPLSFPSSYNQMTSNTFQQNLLTPTSILPTNIRVRPQVQKATRVAQRSLWILPPQLTPGPSINPAFKQVTKCASETQQNQSYSILYDENHSREASLRKKTDLAKRRQAGYHPFERQVNNLPVLPEPPATQIPTHPMPEPQHPSVSYTRTALFKEIPNPTKKMTIDQEELASVRERMAITALLNDEATNE